MASRSVSSSPPRARPLTGPLRADRGTAAARKDRTKERKITFFFFFKRIPVRHQGSSASFPPPPHAAPWRGPGRHPAAEPWRRLASGRSPAPTPLEGAGRRERVTKRRVPFKRLPPAAPPTWCRARAGIPPCVISASLVVQRSRAPSRTMPKSKELVSSSSSASDSDSEVDKKAKRKKQAAPEKPVKKQKTGESSKGAASSKQSSNRDENMFQHTWDIDTSINGAYEILLSALVPVISSTPWHLEEELFSTEVCSEKGQGTATRKAGDPPGAHTGSEGVHWPRKPSACGPRHI
uniref:SUB1 regulator of transcription n=1 Tax=Apteryx owenii TaxID=8824 RepID=A0A8B9PG25_APTOW